MDLRCSSRILHGIVEDDVIEVACKSARCGKRPGVTVLHRFDKNTGQLLSTSEFREPKNGVKDNNGTTNQGNPIRPS